MQEVSTDGYAKELTQDQAAQTAQVYAEESAKADIIVTTALVRGQAPRTITTEMVENMKPGSVIVDLAASGGGNCESTVPGEKIVTDNGVTIIGFTDLTSRMPAHTSQLYGTNIVNLLKLLHPARTGSCCSTWTTSFNDRSPSPRTARPCGRHHRSRSPRRRSRPRRSRLRRTPHPGRN